MQRTLLSLLCSLSLLLGCSEARTEQQAEGSGSGGEQLATNVNDEDEEGTTRSGEEVASEPDTARSPGACPRSYGDQTPTCAADDFPSDCTYPEGTCGCRQPTYCGGAAPPPMPRTWVCEAPSVPCPAAGTPCSGPGRCSNQRCGWQGVACENGVWTPYFQSPPP
ncbi:MAG: hypothetical protein IPG17_21405 [Sandaracinaceae bacterium]|nr:hypothetical protein [Sandaracinaceae bacterium]MBK6812346.1 hypothetical protein [Sandaracinaceae bacterium]MBK7154284.1 hypothetical protein [Sandaracinaceae bacterium]MBK8411866.1 hypothetical protein [Sandaracinaceae bacterium]